ncbi:aminoglycoside phosphotransferase [Mumia zhuanghuii]|uniref:Maltokinase n=2 Tax=Mumia TaxID=1546255 RepID=A0ABW1QU53_9ACTN|nr:MULTISPECIES: aminoglycoside phosphotransferase [Mumia]KAA1418096.1 aminoglycoside phosphotransferase [Mumia zhuanghuii]
MAGDRTHDLLDYIVRQRWFAGEGAGWQVVRVEPLAWLSNPASGLGVRFELVTVDGPGGTQTYNVPLAYRDEPVEANAYGLVGTASLGADEMAADVYVYDALHDPLARQVLMRGFFEDSPAPSESTGRDPDTVYVSHLPHDEDGALVIDVDSESVLLAVEQSNTSMVVAETAMLKVFRKVVDGRNPDVEIHDALAGPGDDAIAALWGWISATPSGGSASYDLAMLQRFLRTASNGWESARASVRDLLAEPGLEPEAAGGDFAGESVRLGETVRFVHTLMAERLPTAEWGAAELSALADRLDARLDHLAGRVDEIERYAGAARDVYARLRTLDGPVAAQRVHGDLHLGQTLRTTAGWKLIDFEGEPAAALEDRVALDTVWRDVAGVTRSFDYAANSYLLQTGTTGDAEVAQARAWVARNRAAFLAGYGDGHDHEAARPAGGDTVATALLAAYEVDKALYEYVYELDHRPDWAAIPMTMLDQLLG